ncbi:LOG family protein [Alphaproteobacteria bacterium]|nr:LOG family protein [Alphaproteobacteria bacterium]
MAKAVAIIPGGFGTLDEFMEVVALVQTGKIRHKLPIFLFGGDYWGKIAEFEAMVEFGTIDLIDTDLFHIINSVDEALDWLNAELLEWALDHPGTGMTA